MLLAILGHMSFHMADTFFVAQLGALELTAISFSFPVAMVLLNLAIGYNIGCTSVLSRIVGSGKPEQALIIGSSAVWLMLLLASLLCIAGMLSIEPLFQLLGARAEHIPYIRDYMLWTYPAMALRMLAIAISSLFKSHGLVGIPSQAMLITAGLNIVLDPILIFGWLGMPALGMAGAGIASFVANLLAVIYELWMASARGYGFLQAPKKLLPADIPLFSQIFRIGFPSALANALNPISVSLGNYFLAQSSLSAVAGFGVATKLQSFAMIPVFALSSATGPLIGQNFAAQLGQRCRQVLYHAFACSFVVYFLQIFILYFGAEWISSYFSDQADIVASSRDYLQLVAFSLIGYSAVILVNSALNAINAPFWGFSLILARTLVFFVLAYQVFMLLEWQQGVYWGYFASNLLSLIFSFAVLFWIIRWPQPKK